MYRESTQKRPNVRPKVFGIWLLSWFDVQPCNKIKDQIVTSCFSYVFLKEDIQDADFPVILYSEILELTMAPYLLNPLDLWVTNLVPLNFGRCTHPIGQAMICSFIWASENINTTKNIVHANSSNKSTIQKPRSMFGKASILLWLPWCPY